MKRSSVLAEAISFSEERSEVGPFERWADHWWDWYTLLNYRREAQALILYDPVFPANPFIR